MMNGYLCLIYIVELIYNFSCRESQFAMWNRPLLHSVLQSVLDSAGTMPSNEPGQHHNNNTKAMTFVKNSKWKPETWAEELGILENETSDVSPSSDFQQNVSCYSMKAHQLLKGNLEGRSNT